MRPLSWAEGLCNDEQAVQTSCLFNLIKSSAVHVEKLIRAHTQTNKE